MVSFLLFLTALVTSQKPTIVSNPIGHGEREELKKPNVDDIHYNVNEIARLKDQGIDTSNFTVATSHDVPVGHAVYNDDYTNRWTQTDTDGKIVLAWSVMEGYPYEAETTRHMDQFGRDLGCIKTVKVERSDLSSTKWQQGLMFVWSTHTTGGCWSALGQVDGYSGSTTFQNIAETGAPSGWQAIAMDDNCGGASAATVMHEALHALGTGHEHNRPDRDTYLHVDTSQSFMPSQYYKLDEKYWLETGHPFELGSVMTYCSMCSASGSNPVATLKNGDTFSDGLMMTTTDALQIQYRYCNSREGFVYKEHLTCPNADVLGFQLPIFTDRLCDNNADCPGMSDEDGTLVPCIPFGEMTDNGCCNSYFYNGHDFVYAGVYNDRDYFTTTDSSSRVQHIAYKRNWVALINAINETSYSYLDEIASPGKCPPTDTVWEYGGRVVCKVDGPSLNNFCEENDCHENAVCKNRFADYECVCGEGYNGDGRQCEKLLVEDECTLKTDNCSATGGKCIDEKYGFRCECETGYVDEAPEQSGTQCVACCKSFEFWRLNELTRTCTFNETLSDGKEKYIYDCILPDQTKDQYHIEYLDTSWMEYQWALMKHLPGSLIQYIARTIDVDQQTQCLASEEWDSSFTTTCVEYFVFEDETDAPDDGTEGSGEDGIDITDGTDETDGTDDTDGSGGTDDTDETDGTDDTDCDARNSVVICRLDMLGILVPSCALPEDAAILPYMGENKHCVGALEENSLVFRSNNYECRILPTNNGTHLIYRSSVNWEAGSSNAIITRSNSIRIEFECVFETELTLSLDGITPMLNTVDVDLGLENGVYELSFGLWEDETFSTPLAEDAVISVPDKLYLGATLSDPGMFFTRLENCWATPSADAENDIRYDFITGGCGDPVELAEQTLVGVLNGQAPYAMFIMESFQFKTISHEVYIHCQIHICDPEYEDCEPTCAISRRKRSAPSKVSKLSVGPITVES